VNPGASLFFAGSDSAVPVRHAGPDRAGYADIAARSGAGDRVARPAHSPSGSRFARDRSGCRPAPAGDSGRKEKAGPQGPCSQRPRDGPPRPLVRYCPRNRAQHGSGHGADVNLAVWVGAMPPFLTGAFLSDSCRHCQPAHGPKIVTQSPRACPGGSTGIRALLRQTLAVTPQRASLWTTWTSPPPRHVYAVTGRRDFVIYPRILTGIDISIRSVQTSG
jgi:hypothetical protein